jgi:CRP-like cAMP-binding protein
LEDAEKLVRLRGTDFLGLLPRESLEELVRHSREMTLEAGQVLFHEGDAGRAMYVVLSGRMGVRKGEKEIADGGPGTYYGEMALIESKVRSATVHAIEATRILEITEEEYNRLRDKQAPSGSMVERWREILPLYLDTLRSRASYNPRGRLVRAGILAIRMRVRVCRRGWARLSTRLF